MTGAEPTIGLAFAGDAHDLQSWSGIPANLAGGLESLGVKVVHVSAEPPTAAGTLALNGLALTRVLRAGSLRQARRQARASPAFARLRTHTVNRRLKAAPAIDALIQIHAEFRAAAEAPIATYEDLTVVQALHHGYAEVAGLSPTEQQRRIAIQREVYEGASACCTTTHWAKDSIVDDYGIPPARVHVVGIATDRRPPDRPPNRDWSVPRFLFVGWDWQRKNGEGLLDAFAKVRAQIPRAELHLVGGHPDLAAEGVTGHGPLRLDRPADRAQVDELYRRATCFVMPSRVEPSAIAYIEAATFGLPSIGTTVGGSAELIGDGGIVVGPGDAAALSNAMLDLCAPARAAELGARAATRAPLYTWPAVAARILAALQIGGFDAPALT